MAVYFLRCRHISRGKGSRATRAAAYRAGERIRDERTSEVYDHSDRRDVAYKEVVLPSDLTGRADMAWTQDRATLWNAAEHAGLRRNSRLAREWLVFLPPELSAEQRTRLARTFATELADKYRCAVDVAVHTPRPGADPRNHHAHMLMTTREVTPDGLGRRTALELGGRERHQLGVTRPTREEYLALRERWAQVTNEALRHAGLAARVDHLSLDRQGLNREPTPTIPEKVFYAEQRLGAPSAAGDEIRSRYRERLEARLKGADELARVLTKQRAQLKEGAQQRRSLTRPPTRWGGLTREQRNEKRREQYQTRRAAEKLDSVGEAKRREASRLQWRQRMQRDPEAIREAQRRWRSDHKGEKNRNQREYRKTHAQELALKRREHRKAHAEEVNRKQREYRKTHAPELALKRREYRKIRRQEQARAQRADRTQSTALDSPKLPSLTAEESAKRWKAYRDNSGPGPTAEESARNWLAFRERQNLSDSSPTPTTRTHERGIADDDDDADRKTRRQQRDHEYEP